MVKPKPGDASEAAMLRFSLIAPVVNGTYTQPSEAAYFRDVSERPVTLPDGTVRYFNPSTLATWESRYRRHGFDGLVRKGRGDAGRSRKIGPEVESAIRALREAHPRMNCVEMRLRLIADGTIGADDFSDSTIQRWVYNSQHVVLDQTSNLNMNPYFTEFTFSNQRAELRYGDDLQYNEATRSHTEAVLGRVFPADAGRVLAVVVRGTDYNAAKVADFVPHGLTAEETLAKAIEYVKNGQFDHVYLCTEDASYLELFLASELADKLLYVDQERIDYGREENDEKLLLEIFARDQSNPYTRTLDYIAVLEGLTRCQALLANVTCGAVTYALNRGTDYEFVDVGQIQSGLNG